MKKNSGKIKKLKNAKKSEKKEHEKKNIFKEIKMFSVQLCFNSSTIHINKNDGEEKR